MKSDVPETEMPGTLPADIVLFRARGCSAGARNGSEYRAVRSSVRGMGGKERVGHRASVPKRARWNHPVDATESFESFNNVHPLYLNRIYYVRGARVRISWREARRGGKSRSTCCKAATGDALGGEPLDAVSRIDLHSRLQLRTYIRVRARVRVCVCVYVHV